MQLAHHLCALVATLMRLFMPGILMSAALGAAAMGLASSKWMQQHGGSALTISIVLGMLLGNTVYPRIARHVAPGVDVAKQKLLRLGVALYGLRLTLQDVEQLGLTGMTVDVLVLGSTFALACWVGIRWLGLDRPTVILIGAGSAICGAAAVLATEPVIKARAEQVAVAVACVVVFGTLAMFLYPVIYTLNLSWPVIMGGSTGFGTYIGSTVYEVAQVIAAASTISAEATDTAVMAKMVRVLMLAPFLLFLTFGMERGRSVRVSKPSPVRFPWFVLGFAAVVLINSLHWLPLSLVVGLHQLGNVLLATAMAALGLTTHMGAVFKAGLKPLLLAFMLFAWLVGAGALINRWVPALLA